VLIALFEGGAAGAEVVLTRRSWQMRNHRGEVSFPGGRMEPGETPVEAALREAEEEVGLAPASVTVVGELDHLATVVSRSLIVPVVGTLPGRPRLRPASTEVERVLTVPLAELLRPDTYHEERWGTPPLDRPLHFFLLDDETVWGATGFMLHQLLLIATGSAPTRR
jgi:8-oxo-dGTP pyrophosphatase MutT (NUDIX family)